MEDREFVLGRSRAVQFGRATAAENSGVIQMARTERFRFSHTRKLDAAYRYVSEAAAAGVVMNDGHGPNGRYVTVNGERLKSFGSCSYMALEAMPQVRESAHRAIDEYGTQFHFSRA